MHNGTMKPLSNQSLGDLVVKSAKSFPAIEKRKSLNCGEIIVESGEGGGREQRGVDTGEGRSEGV